ncbi:NACHT domain-containing protein [Streptomyces sp. NPDC005925]|uniref:NACHT domain-containing protein n=1 Tax=Streptomyces sp. NPDC005925 TaxID=3157172 RepID=UPI0033CAF141
MAVYAVVRSALEGFHGAPPVDLLALVVTMTAVLQGVAYRRKDLRAASEDRGRTLAAQLARQVLDAETPQFRQLIGDDDHRINLHFVRRTSAVRPASNPHGVGRMYLNPDESSTASPDIHTYYQSTQPKRLLITGKAGAGKTALLLELLLALVENRQDDEPVPLRMGLAQYDTRLTVAENVASHLMAAYNWRHDEALELVKQGRVLPVLDGLDEMDRAVGDPAHDQQRARALLDHLNRYQRGRYLAPVILTCRTTHYDALPRNRQLRDAARIEVAPVDAEKACAYLGGRALDPQAWQPVLDHIRRTSTSALAVTLSNPWRLTLAATVFAHEGDPADLLRHPAIDDPDKYLLGRLIPASTGLADPRPYSSADVHRWLAGLAVYHHEHGTSAHHAPGTSVDIVLHHIWPASGPVLTRFLHVLVVTAGVAAFSDFVMGGLDKSMLLYFALLCLPAARIGLSPRSAPKRFDPRRLFTRRGLRQVVVGLAFSLPAAAGVGVVFALVAMVLAKDGPHGFIPYLSQGFGFGLLIIPAASLYFAFNRGLSDALTPRDPLRNDLRFGLSLGLIFWFSYGLVFWPVYRRVYALQHSLGIERLFENSHVGGRQLTLAEMYQEHGPLYGFTSGTAADLLHTFHVEYATVLGCAAGLMEALVFGVALGAGAWTRYAIAVTISSVRSGLPLRLDAFLDWAYRAGILRISGISYQFRHLELQEWLLQNPSENAASHSP